MSADTVLTSPETPQRLIGLRQLGRAVRAEFIRAGGPRSSFMLAALPGAILLPLIVTLAIAFIGERFSTFSDEIEVFAVSTDNSVYWVLTFTVTFWALIAAVAEANASRGADRDRYRYLFPRTVTASAARWITYGLCAAVSSVVLAALIMVLLPIGFPIIYGEVDIASTAGVRFLITIPIYAIAVCGIGVGLGALIAHPAGAAVILLAWAYLVETNIGRMPNGYTVQGYMPFLNGQYGTGQQLAFTPPWGPNGALIYCVVVAVVVFGLGYLAALRRRRRS